MFNFSDPGNNSKKPTTRRQASIEEPQYDFSIPTIARPQMTSGPVVPASNMASLPVVQPIMTSLLAVPTNENVYADIQPLFYSDERPKARSVIEPRSQQRQSSNPYPMYGSSPVLEYTPVSYVPSPTVTYAHAVPAAPTIVTKPIIVKKLPRKKNILWNRVPCVLLLVLLLSALMVGGIIGIVVLVQCKYIHPLYRSIKI